jgi:IS30 family transposase
MRAALETARLLRQYFPKGTDLGAVKAPSATAR